MSQEFIKELERLKAKQGGFNTPTPAAPSLQPQAPQELSTPQVGPTLANEAQLPVSAPAIQTPQELTADSLGPVAFPGLQEQAMDTRLEAAGEEQQRMNAMSSTLSDGQIQGEREGSTVGGFVENAARKGFDYFFGAPTAEQAQNILDTQPTDPAQRARLQATAAGTGSPSDLSKAASYLFGRPENAGDPNILGSQAPAVASDDPFGVTPEQIAAAGNENFGKAVAENPYRSQYGVNSLDQKAIGEIQQQGAAAPQAQAPQGLNSTQAMLQERFGSPTISGIQSAEEGLGMRTDAQGRMIDPNVDRSSFEQASADLQARQAARPDFGEAQERAAGTVTDAERRGNGAPTALFKEEAEAAGLSGRAKSDFISEKTRLWIEAKEDREIERASGQAAGERANIEMQLKIKDWEKTNADERKERVDEMNTEIGALTSIIGQAENISGVAQEAGRQVGAGTTGFFSPLKWIGGTTAADLAGNLETIKSDAFVANITEMRKNSPTGGAVGNVSDKDLEMLQSLQTTFRQNLKPTTLRANLKKYQKIRAKVVADAKKGFVLKYGQENLNKHFGDQQQTAGKGSSAIPNDRNVTTSNNELYEKHSQ